MSATKQDLAEVVVLIDPAVSELAAEAARLRRMHVDAYIQVLIDSDLRSVKPRWHNS